jgi:outer membrane protein assembly factor BamB
MNLGRLVSSIFLLVGSSLVTSALAQDWNQWQGPNRDGVWLDPDVLVKFPNDGPKVLWRAEVANGYAGPAVAGGKVFVADYVKRDGDDTPDPGKLSELQGTERLLCLDAKTGKQLWKHDYDCDYKFSYPNGPRATPTVDGDRVYFLGAEGNLSCLLTADGSVVWSRDLKKDYQMKQAPWWGFAAHPLVDEDTLYCIVGGKGSIAVAFDKHDGKEKWRALDAKSSGYCPPTMIEAGGTKQLLIWHPEALNGLNPETGEVYWSYRMKPAYDMSIIAPIKSGDYLYATALQGTSVLLKLDASKPAVTEVWTGHGPHPDHNPPLIAAGHIFGIDEQGQMRCFQLISGERLWESLATAPKGRPKNSATGFVVRNQDVYYAMIETGELVIAKMGPAGFEELDRAKLLEPTSRTGNRSVVWSHPAFCNRCVFARNDKEIVCVSLAK